jgi:hypothetical protein
MHNNGMRTWRAGQPQAEPQHGASELKFTPTRSRRQCRVTVTPSRVLNVYCWHSAETRARFALRTLLSDPEIPNSRSPDSRRIIISRFGPGRELESGIPAGNPGRNPRSPIRPKSGSRESPIPDSAKIGKWDSPIPDSAGIGGKQGRFGRDRESGSRWRRPGDFLVCLLTRLQVHWTMPVEGCHCATVTLAAAAGRGRGVHSVSALYYY